MAYNVTAQLNLQLNPQSINQIAQALNSITSGKSIGGNLFNTNQIRGVTNELNNSKNAMMQFGEQAGLAAKRFGAFTLTAGALVQVTQGFRTMLNEAIAFDREMVKLKQVSNDTAGSGVAAIRQEIDKLATGLGVSSSQLARVSVILKQANLNLGETKTALEALALSALAPNFDSMEKTAEGAIAVLKQFKIPVEELKSSLGSINAVAGEFAVEASDLIGVIQRTGGAFKAAGGNLNELLALFTSVRQTTRESAESIATGLRTIFTRIQRTGTADALREVGVNLRYTRDEALALGNVNLTSQFVGAYEAVRRLSVALNQIPATDPKFAQLVEELGGYRQISKVIPLIQEFSISQNALNVAITGGASLMNSAAAAQGSFGNRLDKLKESYLQFGRSITDSTSFKTLFTMFETGAKSALILLEAIKPLIPMLTVLTTMKVAQSFGSFGAGFVSGVMPSKKSSGGLLHFKKGGIVPGSGHGDIVPAMLEPGEMVIPKKMVKKYSFGGPHTADIDEEALNNPSGFRSFMKGSTTINPKTGKYRKFFHGTKGQDFDYFSNAHARNTWFGRGHYFSADAKVASRYSETDATAGGYDPGARVMSATLQMKNPYTWNSDKSLKDFLTKGGKKIKSINGQFDQKDWDEIVKKGVLPEDISQGTLDHLNKIFTKFPSIAKKWNQPYSEKIDKDGNKIIKGMSPESKMKFVAHGATKTLKKQGYDSVNVDYGLGKDYFNASTVFHPKQIKSLGNEGKWDPSLKEIGKNLGGLIQKFAIGGDVDESKINNPEGFRAFMKGSKTLNAETGKYKKFFHGTRGDNFNTFNNSKTGGNFYGKAHYFAQDYDSASSYSGQDTVRNIGSRVLPTTLQMKNPYSWDEDKSINDLVTAGEALKVRNGKLDRRTWNERIEMGAFPEDISEDTLNHANKIFARFPSIAQAFNKMDTAQQRKFFSHVASKALQKQGFDSINIGTDYSAVFKSNQIKSLYNTGTWDSKNTDIMKNLGGYITRQKFGSGGISKLINQYGYKSLGSYYDDNTEKNEKGELIDDTYKTKIRTDIPYLQELKKTRDELTEQAIKIWSPNKISLSKETQKRLDNRTKKEKDLPIDHFLTKKEKEDVHEANIKIQAHAMPRQGESYIGKLGGTELSDRNVSLNSSGKESIKDKVLNKIRGGLAEQAVHDFLVSKGYNVERLPFVDAADFIVKGNGLERILEVKTNKGSVSDDKLAGKALIAARTKLNKNKKAKNKKSKEYIADMDFYQTKASGGFIVPGVGDTDSVPMDLPVGSYVIKKSSTKKMGFANGGLVPALLTPGELVIDPKTASGIGRAKLDHMNRTGRSAFAKGGRVGFASGGSAPPGSYGHVFDAMMANQFSGMSPVIQSVVQGLSQFYQSVYKVTNVTDAQNTAVARVNQLMQETAKLQSLSAGTAAYTRQQVIVQQIKDDINKKLEEVDKVRNKDAFTQLAHRETGKEMIAGGYGGISRKMQGDSVKSLSGSSIEDQLANIKMEKNKLKINEDFIQKTQAQLMAMDKSLSATEARTAAERLAANATLKDIARNATGEIIGHKELANRGFNGLDLLNEKNKSPQKQSLWGRTKDFFTGGSTKGATPEQIAEIKAHRLNMATMGLGLVASYGGEFLSSGAGNPQDIAKNNGSGGAVHNLMKAGAGGLQGAAMGATIGSFIPVIGTVVGGAIGGITGAISSGFSANKELLDAASAESQDKLGNLINKMSNKTEKLDIKTLASAVNSNMQNAGLAAGASTGILDYIGFSRSASQRQEDVIKATEQARQQTSGQTSVLTATAISEKLSAQKGGVETKTNADLYKLSSTIIEADDNFLSLIESSRQVGESFHQAKERIVKDASNMARAEASKKAAIDLEKTIGRSNTFLKSFADNLEGASARVEASFKNFDSIMASLESGNRVSQNYQMEKNAKVFNNPSAFTGNEFKQSIESTFGQFGPQLTGDLSRQYAPMAEIGNKLPQILAESIDKKNPQEAIQSQLEKIVPGGKNDPAVKAIITSLTAKLGSKDTIKDVSNDTSKLAEELLQPLMEPMKVYGSKINQLNLDNANKLSAGFVRLNTATMNLINGMEQADNLRMEQMQTMASASDLMRGGTGEIGPNPQASMGMFLSQQQRLLGRAGRPDLIGNSAGIGNAMQEAMDRQRNIEQTDKSQFKGGEFEKQKAFAEAGLQVELFKKSLQDTVTKLQGVAAEFAKQAAEMGKQRNAGASLAKKLALGGPEAQRDFKQGLKTFWKLQTGQITAQQVMRNPRLAARLEKFSEMAGETKIGGVNVADAINSKVYEPAANRMFGTPTRQQEAMVKMQEAGIRGEAAKAQEVLNKISSDNIVKANQELIKSQAELQLEIQKLILTMQMTQEKTINTEDKGGLDKKQKTLDALKKANITNEDAQVIAKNEKEFNKLSELDKTNQQYKDIIDKTEQNINNQKDPKKQQEMEKLFNKKFTAAEFADSAKKSKAISLLSEATGLSSDQAEKALKYSTMISSKGKQRTVKESLQATAEDAAYDLSVEKTKAPKIVQDIYSKMEGQNTTDIIEGSKQAVSAGGINELQNQLKISAQRQAESEQKIKSLEQQLNNITQQNGQNRIHKFAKGGVVPGTGNTDSVPALLTPGEIVIPKGYAEGGSIRDDSSISQEDLELRRRREAYWQEKKDKDKIYGIYSTYKKDENKSSQTTAVETPQQNNTTTQQNNVNDADYSWYNANHQQPTTYNAMGQAYLQRKQMFDQLYENAGMVGGAGVSGRINERQIRIYRMKAAEMLNTQMMINAQTLQNPNPSNMMSMDPQGRRQLMMRIQQMQATRIHLLNNPRRFNSEDEIDQALAFYGIGQVVLGMDSRVIGVDNMDESLLSQMQQRPSQSAAPTPTQASVPTQALVPTAPAQQAVIPAQVQQAIAPQPQAAAPALSKEQERGLRLMGNIGRVADNWNSLTWRGQTEGTFGKVGADVMEGGLNMAGRGLKWATGRANGGLVYKAEGGLIESYSSALQNAGQNLAKDVVTDKLLSKVPIVGVVHSVGSTVLNSQAEYDKKISEGASPEEASAYIRTKMGLDIGNTILGTTGLGAPLATALDSVGASEAIAEVAGANARREVLDKKINLEGSHKFYQEMDQIQKEIIKNNSDFQRGGKYDVFKSDGSEKNQEIIQKLVEHQMSKKLQEKNELNPAEKHFQNKLLYRADGGSIFKPMGTDTVPAMLTPGEFVMKKSAVDSIGINKLTQMNNSKSYFAGGGFVGNSANLDQSASFNQAAAGFDGFAASFNASVTNFNASVETFGAKVAEFASAVATMPATLTVNGDVGANVTTNSAGIISQISNAVQSMIASQVVKSLPTPSMDQASKPS